MEQPGEADFFARVKELFLEVLDLDADARRVVLDKECARDERLRAEVESLLSHQTGEAESTAMTGSAPDPLSLQPGTLLAGRYLVHDELGRGGMGRVFRATDTRFDREVAVKVLALSGSSAKRAFEREARLLNALRHRALPVVTDYFTDELRCCLVMDFVPGEDLAALTARRSKEKAGVVDVDTVVGWAEQILDALIYLATFDPPIVHRDIKPQNIKITERGDAILIDFGLAKGTTSESEHSSMMRSIPGYTPRFAPLEQARGSGTDPRSDLYSLGITLHYVLTGKLPPDSSARAEALLEGKPDPLTPVADLNAAVGRTVSDLIQAATAVRRNDRPASAAVLRSALTKVAAGENPLATDLLAVTQEGLSAEATMIVSTPPNNLPQPVTGFIGREVETLALRELLGSNRLVTLTGLGGIGKTRLALRVASEVLEHPRDGAWFVDLATVGSSEHVDQTIAAALGLQEDVDRPALQVVCDHLRNSNSIVIVDNCEHLIEAASQAIDKLLTACPHISILATSRERIGLTGESVFVVEPLPPPSDDSEDSAAMRLFVSRARLARPSFAVTDKNRAMLAKLCRTLEGIPLAIELAAARVSALSVEQIFERLADRFSLLTTRDRNVPSRQQALVSAIDWSYSLLSEREQEVLRTCAIFPAGFALDAAEQVFPSSNGTVLDDIAGLIDKSLLRLEEREGTTRYRMLETVRVFALRRLAEAGGTEAASRALYDWALGLARITQQRLQKGGSAEDLAIVDIEIDNLRAAMSRARDGEPAAGLVHEIPIAMHSYWRVRGHLTEAQSWMEAALERTPKEDVRVRANLLNCAGICCTMRNEHRRAIAFYDEVIALAAGKEPTRELAQALTNAAISNAHSGNYSRAIEQLEEALRATRLSGRRESEAYALFNLGLVLTERDGVIAGLEYVRLAHEAVLATGHDYLMPAVRLYFGMHATEVGDIGEAQAHLRSAVEMGRSAGEREQLSEALDWLAVVEDRLGNREMADALLAESVDVRKQMSSEFALTEALLASARLASQRGLLERALILDGAATGVREGRTFPTSPRARKEIDSRLAAARDTLGREAADAAVAKGRAMGLSTAVILAADLEA